MTFINWLINPKALPDPTEKTSLIQTHISFVIIADNFVYKIKKAVNLGFLDFSTLRKRRYYCQREIDLNRRLSDDIYIDMLPVCFNNNSYRIGGEGSGKIVDYAVRMKRIPENMIMKYLFQNGLLTNEHLFKISAKLAHFYKHTLNSNHIDRFGSPDLFKINTDENFQQTERYKDITINTKDFEQIKSWTNDFYKKNSRIFYDRIKSKKIRDCHGDLHMEHICLTDSINIFDCIEFNKRFRYTDTLADIAFLLMDLEYRGGRKFAEKLWNDYERISGDSNMIPLLKFYKIYRAYVRGKVISFQLNDEYINIKTKDDVIDKAKRYFQLAKEYIE